MIRTEVYGPFPVELKGMELSLLGTNKVVYVTDSVSVYFKNSGPSVKNYKVISKLSHAFCVSNK